MSDTDTAAWAALLRVHAGLVPLLDRELQAACRLPLTWYDVLLELNAARGKRLSMGELGQVAVVSRTRVSRVVDELAREGLVRRQAHPQDARSAYAALTPEGLSRFKEAAPVYVAGIERQFAQALSDTDLRAVARALGRVRESLAASPQV